MKCSECNSDTTVRKTTEVNGSITRRYRRCLKCSRKITTIELPEHLARTNVRRHDTNMSRIRKKVQDVLDFIDDPAND